MRHLFLICFTLLFAAGQLNGDVQHSRIHKLLPNLLIPFNIDPMIPNDYVAMSPKGQLDVYDWIYWGPKDTLETFFKDGVTLDVPIIRVKLSANVAQTGPDSFTDEDTRAYIIKHAQVSPQLFGHHDYMWGDYPVHALKVTVMNMPVYMAHVGLNDREGHHVLMFNMIYPRNSSVLASEADVQFWDSFLENTTGY